MITVNQELVKDFKTYLAPFFKKVLKSNDGQRFKISKYKIFRYEGDTVTVSVDHTFNHDSPTFVTRKQSINPSEINLTRVARRLYTETVKVNPKKVADVLKLCDKYVPQAYRQYYDKLLPSNEELDNEMTSGDDACSDDERQC